MAKSETDFNSAKSAMKTINRFYEQTPAFQDVFDEDSFYVFAFAFTIGTIVMAIFASKHIKLKCRD